MGNAGLEEAQAGIKTAERNINNLRYADDTTLMAKSKEKLKSLLMKVKEESDKAGLNSTFRKGRLCHPVPSIHRWGNSGNSDFLLGRSKITADGDCSHEIKRHLLLGRKAMTKLDSISKTRDSTLPRKVHLIKARLFR